MISALLGIALPLKSIRVRFLPRRYYCYIGGGERNHLIVRTRKFYRPDGGRSALGAEHLMRGVPRSSLLNCNRREPHKTPASVRSSEATAYTYGFSSRFEYPKMASLT